MGWGCNKHEIDAGSITWNGAEQELCEYMLDRKPRTFGRDGRICPLCWRDMEDKLAKKDREIDSLVSEVNKANARSAKVGRCIDCSVIGQGLCSRHSTCPTCESNAKELEAARGLKKGDYACHLIGCTGATIRSCTCGLMALLEAIKDE